MSGVILVASGKGGVGKSTFSAACGMALARQGIKTLIIDGDMGLRSLDILLNASDKVVYDWLDVINGSAEPEDAVLEILTDDVENLYFVPAPIDTKLPSEEDFCKLIKYYSESYERIIIDAPAGVGELLGIYAKTALHSVVVATSDAASIRSAYRTGVVLGQKGMRDIRLVINKVRPELVRAGENPYLDEVIDKSEIRLIGVVPFSQAVAQSSISGKLSFGQDSTVKKAFDNIALRLMGKNVKLTKL